MLTKGDKVVYIGTGFKKELTFGETYTLYNSLIPYGSESIVVIKINEAKLWVKNSWVIKKELVDLFEVSLIKYLSTLGVK